MGYSPILGRFLQRDPMGDLRHRLAHLLGSNDLVADLGDAAPDIGSGTNSMGIGLGGRSGNWFSTLQSGSQFLGRLGLELTAQGANLYAYALDNPVRYLDPSGEVTATSSYSPPVLAGVCFGSCKCTGIPNFKGVGWAVIDIPNAFEYVLEVAASMGLATKTCGLETCNACSLGANPATQPIRQTACVQAAMRANYWGNPAITCGCT